MTEQEILIAFRASLKQGDVVRHRSDWELGTVMGKSSHPAYDVDVIFNKGPGAEYPVYARNLFPEWWPAPEWVPKKETSCGR